MHITDITALVTGANRGLGRALVEALLDRGARRVYATARNVSELAMLREADSRVVPLTLDVTNAEQVGALGERVHGVSLLVNNAAILSVGSALSVPIDRVRDNLETNYIGTLHVARALAPQLIQMAGNGQPSALVNILTLTAMVSAPPFSAYNASKAAAWSLTQSLRAELAPHDVRVHGVFPGAIDTDMLRGVEMPKTSPADVAARILDGIEQGEEDIYPDPMAGQVITAWRADHKSVERQFAAF